MVKEGGRGTASRVIGTGASPDDPAFFLNKIDGCLVGFGTEGGMQKRWQKASLDRILFHPLKTSP
jgi:hypothetical protein